MRYLIFSDVHGNLEALEAVLDDAARFRVAETICLGDIVGYGADPNECIGRVREVADLVLMGNHDHAAVGLTDPSSFNPYARSALLWTRQVIKEEQREYLRRLPMYRAKGSVFVVHATPCLPEKWNYIFTMEQLRANFRCFSEQICFIGHSHQPMAAVLKDGKYGFMEAGTFRLRPGARYIVNAGSVGQPRDGNPEAAYVIFDDRSGDVELIRTPYDVSAAQMKILGAQLHPYLAQRLAFGR